MIAPIDGKPALEVGMIGREGMLGAQLVPGVPTVPLHALVQGSRAAWRLGAGASRAELARSAALQRLLKRYVCVLMAQLAGSAACIRFHEIGPRLARWLLMSQDRAHAKRFHVTQEFLAYMLGVRRVGITAAAGDLQRRGLIEYRRARCGCVTAAASKPRRAPVMAMTNGRMPASWDEPVWANRFWPTVIAMVGPMSARCCSKV